MGFPGESKLPPMRVVFKPRIQKTSEVRKLINFCLMTTNIGEKQESILHSIIRTETLSQNQYRALNEIAVQCALIKEPYQTILRTVKFDEEPEAPKSVELPEEELQAIRQELADDKSKNNPS